MEKCALFRSDVDERGLNAGKDSFYSTQVNVAHHSAGFGPINEQFDELVVLENGDTRLARVRVDQNFSFHLYPPRFSLPATHRDGGGGEARCKWPRRASQMRASRQMGLESLQSG